jgi:Glycoside Hydrolase Family 113
VAARRPVAAALAAAAALALLAASPKPPAPRKIAVRQCEGVQSESAFTPEWTKRRNLEVQVGPEGAPVPKGYEVVHICALPLPPAVETAVAKFPVTLDAKGFTFDGRTYSGEDDAILLSDPSRPGEFFALGMGPTGGEAVLLAQRRAIFAEFQGNYLAVTGGINGLTKTGRFVAQGGSLQIDRASDKDAIGARDEFYRSLKKEKHGNVEWELRDSEKAAAARWEKVASGYAGKKGFRVRVYPDAAIKALYTGSSRPADVVADDGTVRVDIDAAAPEQPDLISPALATAGLAAANPALLDRPIVAAAAGAQRFGRWWGRDVRTFAAFTHAAGVDPSIDEVVRGDATAVDPVLAVGSAASWLDAGARLDSDAAVAKALAAPDAALSGKLFRWRDSALRQSIRPPERRALPEGFLRGVSLASGYTIEGGYGSDSAEETLRTLAGLSVNAISLMPSAIQPDPRSPEIQAGRGNPRFDTDEGMVRALSDARTAGMTVMVKPQLSVGEGALTEDIAMPTDAAWRAWFTAYRRFVVHDAVVAEAAGAALFCVGTEVRGTEEHKNDWKEVIAAVRLATGAPLTYAAGWAAGAADIPFWDALDAIGIDFYDPLARTEKASDAVLEEGARRAASAAAALSKRYSDKPVVFTEAGYLPLRGSWTAPRDSSGARPAAPDDAARAVAAVYRALSREPWWMGVFWWKVYSDGRTAAAGERGFNLLGTPAQKAVVDGFREMAAGRP